MRGSFLAIVFLCVFACRAQDKPSVATAHFLLMASRDIPVADLAWIAETLEQAHDRLAREWRIVLPRRIPVHVYSTSSGFTTATGMPWFMKAALVGRTIHLQSPSILKRYALLNIIMHELVHAHFAGLGTTRVPRWFAEGCATYLSGSPARLPEPSSPLPMFNSLDLALGSRHYQQQRQAYADAREYIRALIRLGGNKSLAILLHELGRQTFEQCFNSVFHLSVVDFGHATGQ